MNVDEALASAFREHSGRILAALVRQVGDLDLAEDALQDAVSEAVTCWRRDGIPDNCSGWLFTVCKRRAIDRIRLETKQRALVDASLAIKRLETLPTDNTDDELPDERLRLIFTCCHPALPDDAQVALTLRTVCGLTTEEVARAFLVSCKTMRQRIARAKNKIREKGISYAIPEGSDIEARLAVVLDVVYFIFNEGYAPTESATVTRAVLCDEAIRLGRILYHLTPKPEVGGLLALMLLHDSRRESRIDADGRFVPLKEQDRSLWKQVRIDEGRRLLQECLAHRQPGQFQILASISAVHAEAKSFEKTDWIQIAGLYVGLSQAAPSPVVTLNYAVAVSYADNPHAALNILYEIAPQLQEYQSFHAALADVLCRTANLKDATDAYKTAIELTRNGPELRFLENQLHRVGKRLREK